MKAHGHMMVSVLEATRGSNDGSHAGESRGVTWEATDLYLEGKTGFACSSGTWLFFFVFFARYVIFTGF